MSVFRKRPVEVEARRFVTPELGIELAKWCGGVYRHDDGVDTIAIVTLEGVMTAHVGDWIIRGVEGEFYPCRVDIFEQTYERVA